MSKSTFGNRPGNTNMKGKKHLIYGCKCCACRNLKDKFSIKSNKKDFEDQLDYYNETKVRWQSGL